MSDPIVTVKRDAVAPATERERCPTCGRAIPYWTPARIVAAFHRWEREFGAPPKVPEWQKRKTPWHPTINVVRSVMGSWSAAIRAAGYEPRRRGDNRLASAQEERSAA